MVNQHTIRQYKEFQQAYDYFNGELWNGDLPQLLVTLQRKPKMLGHFAPERYEHRSSADVIHEIALNPDGFVGEDDEEILSTLVHEMAHVWQQVAGKPGRRGYHNKEWAAEMKRIGLYPSSTAAKGGKEVGEKMSHYIVDGGAFQVACAALVETGFALDWQSHTKDGKGGADGEEGEDDEPKKKGRIKYTCPQCELNAWAKPEAVLICGVCFVGDPGTPAVMQPVEGA